MLQVSNLVYLSHEATLLATRQLRLPPPPKRPLVAGGTAINTESIHDSQPTITGSNLSSLVIGWQKESN